MYINICKKLKYFRWSRLSLYLRYLVQCDKNLFSTNVPDTVLKAKIAKENEMCVPLSSCSQTKQVMIELWYMDNRTILHGVVWDNLIEKMAFYLKFKGGVCIF